MGNISKKYAFYTALPGIVGIIPVEIAGIRFYAGSPAGKLLPLSLLVFIVAVSLSVIYYFFHYYRMKRTVLEDNANRLFQTPVISVIHTLINFAVLGPIIFVVYNHFNELISNTQIGKVFLVHIFAGLIASAIVYPIGELIIMPYLLKYERRFKGISLFVKLCVVLLIGLIFSWFTGVLFVYYKPTIFLILLPIFLAFLTIFRVLKPIRLLNEGLNQFISDKPNLRLRMKVKTGDEFEDLSEKINKFVEIVSDIVRRIKEISKKIMESSQSISISSEELTSSIKKISSSIDKLNKDNINSNQYVKRVNTEAKTVTSMAEHIESQMKMLTKVTQDSDKRAVEGEKKAEEVLTKIKENITSIKSTEESMKDLIATTQEINSFADILSEVTEDTDLLSLNASVEAARAGEYGKGFAIIAEEIRGLSNQSKEYLDRVVSVLDRVTTAFENFRITLSEGIGRISGSVESMDDIKNALSEISENVILGTNMTNQVSDTIKEEINSISKLYGVISNISETFAITTSAIEGISSSLQEQMPSMEELRGMTEDMLKVSQEMKSSIERCEV